MKENKQTAQDLLNSIGISFPALEEAMDEHDQADKNISKILNPKSKENKQKKFLKEVFGA